MLRYKSNKQAFIIAALVILLCLVSLVGATLALFTSDPNDGTIGIITTSGDVEVDIVDDTDEQTSLVGGFLTFCTSSDRKDILFEPGATYYTQGFKVKNVGTVPVNFRLSVSDDKITDEDENVVDMEEFRKSFDISITTNPNDPAASEPLKPFVGRLEAGEIDNVSETYYLVIKMKESVGNEFQGKSYTGIGVTVYAVQGNVEVKE